ncbi:2,4-dienoyl-CoA reductase [Streptomyces hoynatensis]|uniref:2,4-dienoyl-CoA reductase n=1 Tax=Streptomyces hoynatensis TaxID=1141874 RepID=A0A3A9Z6L3_9ACTN|nr:2,4-dienoyl-CoA reductase [Streptomyces hoynatensis]RKN44001.1 2,4-dienoyl-CoA reductase [Streptomyces hoynatensis]
MSAPGLFAPLVLPSGEVLRNRVVKAAMEEQLGAAGLLPDARLHRLYRRWSAGGAGLLLTGNVMVDGRAATSPAGVALEAGSPLGPFARWAEAARAGGARAWMQLNHPGRQVRADQRGIVLGPSAVAVDAPGFAAPQAMDAHDIGRLVARFAHTAALACEAGFTGVQVHAAHGYLIGQFLSPLANRRDDAYGRGPEGRARLLLEILDAVRARLPRGASLGVKLNTADFQRGGFGPDDAERVVRLLGEHGVDLLELSGGSAVRPAMHGARLPASTRAREAFFLDLAPRLAAAASMPTMLTGGIRARPVAEGVLARGLDAVGVGTALALVPDLPERWRRDPSFAPAPPACGEESPERLAAGTQATVRWLLRRWARPEPGTPRVPPPGRAIAVDRARRTRLLPRYHAYLASRRGEPRV